MSKKVTLLVLMLALLFSAMGTPLFVNLASADVTIYPWDIVYKSPPIITVNSPFNNTILYADSVLLNFTVKKPAGLWLVQSTRISDGSITKQMLTGYGYVFDGIVYGSFPTSSDLSSPINFLANLTSVKGLHTLQVYANATGCVVSTIGLNSQYFPITGWSNTIYFESFPTKPTVEVQPLAVNGTSLSLNFTIDEPVTEITYSIDNQGNVSIAGNTTLTNLPFGSHNFTIYATNPAGNIGASKTVNFTVAFPTEKNELNSVFAVTIVLAVAVTAIFIFFYRRHRKTVDLK